VTGGVTVSSPTAVNTTKLDAGAVITLTGNNFFATNGILAAGGDDSITGSGALTAKPGGSKNIGFYVSEVSGKLTVSVPITDNNEGASG
jgi:hypothetical protein